MLEWKLIRLGDICKTNENSYYPKDNWKFVNYLDTGSLTEIKLRSYSISILKRIRCQVEPGEK